MSYNTTGKSSQTHCNERENTLESWFMRFQKSKLLTTAMLDYTTTYTSSWPTATNQLTPNVANGMIVLLNGRNRICETVRTLSNMDYTVIQ